MKRFNGHTIIGLALALWCAAPAEAQNDGAYRSQKFVVKESPANGTAGVTIQKPSLAASYVLELPPDDGTNGQVLSTDGSGVLSWTSAIGSSILTDPTIRGTALLQNTSGAQPELHLSEDPDNGTNVIKIKAPASTGDVTLTLPDNDGNSGDTLSTNGSGVLSWVAALVNPMDSEGDLIVGGAAGAATKLDAGTATQVLHGGTSPSWSAVSLTADVSGVLPIANGGTNKNLTLAAGGLLYTDADSFEVSSAGTASQWALSGGTGAPTFSDTTTSNKTIELVDPRLTLSDTDSTLATGDNIGRIQWVSADPQMPSTLAIRLLGESGDATGSSGRLTLSIAESGVLVDYWIVDPALNIVNFAHGNITMDEQPSFYATAPTDGSDTTVRADDGIQLMEFGTESWDQGANWVGGTTSAFTAPVSGKYMFIYKLEVTSTSGNPGITMSLAASAAGTQLHAISPCDDGECAAGAQSWTLTWIGDLGVGDTVVARLDVVSGTGADTVTFDNSGTNNTFFTGYLLH